MWGGAPGSSARLNGSPGGRRKGGAGVGPMFSVPPRRAAPLNRPARELPFWRRERTPATQPRVARATAIAAADSVVHALRRRRAGLARRERRRRRGPIRPFRGAALPREVGFAGARFQGDSPPPGAACASAVAEDDLTVPGPPILLRRFPGTPVETTAHHAREPHQVQRSTVNA